MHRGTVVTESGAICAYLADAFPAAGLAPASGSPERGTYFRWMFFGAGCVDPAMLDKMFSRPPPERRGAAGYGCYDDTMNVLETALSPGPFILRDRFSAADVYVASQIAFGVMMKTIEPRPAFQAYLELMEQRPARKRATDQADKIAAQLKASA